MAARLTVGELLRDVGDALRDPFTYSLRRNRLVLVGLVWGLPIPAVALAVDILARGALPEAASIRDALTERPLLHLLLLAHPFLFAWIFGLFGTLQQRKSERISALIRDLESQARTDGLTGLANHRVFHETLAAEVDRARRQRLPLSLLMIDIDNFKALNDRWGHPVGDRILAELAGRVADPLRDYDVAARYGGEEFAVVLPGADAEEALRIAERVRENVAREPFRVRRNLGEDRVTISVGVATHPDHGTGKASLLEAADLALYRAKAAGKNRVAAALCVDPWPKASGGREES